MTSVTATTQRARQITKGRTHLTRVLMRGAFAELVDLVRSSEVPVRVGIVCRYDDGTADYVTTKREVRAALCRWLAVEQWVDAIDQDLEGAVRAGLAGRLPRARAVSVIETMTPIADLHDVLHDTITSR